jgi:hypothetical protein
MKDRRCEENFEMGCDDEYWMKLPRHHAQQWALKCMVNFSVVAETI